MELSVLSEVLNSLHYAHHLTYNLQIHLQAARVAHWLKRRAQRSDDP
jgi:hypothetical protein